MASESPPRRSEFLLDSLFMNSRPFSMERPLVEENPFPDRRGVTECLPKILARPISNGLKILSLLHRSSQKTMNTPAAAHKKNQSQQKIDRFARGLPGLFLLAVAAIYISFTSDHLVGADSGEMIAASFNLGIAHPPGYPLYILLGKLFSLISPFSNVIYTYNLFSTLCFLAAIVVLYKALRLIDVQPAAILIGGCFYVFSPMSIRWLTAAEVFSLHILICSIGIYLALFTISKNKFHPATRGLGLVAGLGGANHHSIVFLFPGFFLIYGYYWLKLPDNRTRIKEFSWLIGAFLLGLACYLQPVISTWLFTNPVSALGISVHNLQDLIDLFLRRLYGTFSLTAAGDQTLAATYWLNRYLVTGLFSSQGLTIFSGVLVIWQVLRTLACRFSLRDATCLVWFLSSLCFFLMVNAPAKHGFEEEILARMYLMPNLVATMLAILALDRLLPAFRGGYKKYGRHVAVFAPVAILIITISNGARQTNYDTIDIELQAGRDVLSGCSPDSMLILNSDSNIFTTFYLQEVEGFRRDVACLAWPMTKTADYRNYFSSRFGDRTGLRHPGGETAVPGPTGPVPPPTRVSTVQWLRALLDSGVDIYAATNIHTLLAEYNEDTPARLSNSLQGIVWKVTTPDKTVSTEELLRRNAPFLRSYLTWLAAVDIGRQPRIKKTMLQAYIAYFQLMRKKQFSTATLVLPLDLLADLCHFIKIKAPEDELADLYLGLFYYRYQPRPSLAAHYLTLFTNNYTGKKEELLRLARSILKTIHRQNERPLNNKAATPPARPVSYS
ncbi:MAG: DUF2723 domain-containing protein [Desulfobacterales bacterium]|nr:DUF2723 domain-containing protein [Desulfobacterales bacterium]